MAAERTKQLLIRVGDSERERWRALADAEQLTLSDLIRSRLSSEVVGRSPRRRAGAVDADLIRQIAKIGNNLNQIARWVNTYKNQADTLTVLVRLSAFEREISRLLDAAAGGRDAH